MELDVSSEQVGQGVAVRVRVQLSSREINRLYLAGDTLIQLPVDGLADGAGGAPIPRTSMFLSELAGQPEGFSRTFVDSARAESFATAVRAQISTALEAI